MTASAPGGTLYGREDELQIVSRHVVRMASGAGSALVINGEAGIGKSALLAAATRQAAQAGAQVLSATGIQAEARLPFAGLHQLLQPILPLAGRLPSRQRAALLSAFGMSDAGPAGPFLVGLAALEVISDAAARSPVLLVADDAQWLDEPSCAVLGFVARRLGDVAAALLIAVRDGFPSPLGDAGLPELRLAGLDDPYATAILDTGSPGLAPALRERLLREAAGNPLALVELPKSVQSIRQSLSRPPSLLPLTDRLERAFAAQQSSLPETTRALLLAAATDDGNALPELLAVASALAGAAVSADELLPAIEIGLVEIGEAGVRFRHPLMRSAIYQAASVSQRRAAHRALATFLADRPDRRAWHQAAAVLGPDEQVAADLEAAAVRAMKRGAITMAIGAYQRAAQLSEDEPSKGRRLLAAAESAFESGDVGLGSDLVRSAESLNLPATLRTWAAWNREVFAESGWSGAAKLSSFVEMAERIRSTGQTGAALDTLTRISMRCYWANPSQQFRSAIVAAAERLEVSGTEPALLEILGCADPLRRGALVNARLEQVTLTDADPAGMFLAGYGASTVWAWNRAMPLLKAAVDGLRAQGRLGLLAQALMTQAWAALHVTRPSVVVSAADEAARLAVETGQAHWANGARLAQALVAAANGETATASVLTQQAEANYRAMGALPMLSLVQFVRGRGAILNQQYAEALGHLRRILDPADPAHHPWVGAWGLADLAEAAMHLGNLGGSRAYLDRLEELAAATSGPFLLAAAAYTRPLVAESDHAEQLYQAALTDELAEWPEFRSRMLLRYGNWLRRQRRAAESRAPLRDARDSFDALGFDSLAQQARVELRAAGESSSRREPRPWNQLTPQEMQIALMAADGMSNREIGQQLYISHRTVSAHLYRIFPKLDITSRSQLHAALS
jgi:DNA-binding CsgD family transcriptional regulator